MRGLKTIHGPRADRGSCIVSSGACFAIKRGVTLLQHLVLAGFPLTFGQVLQLLRHLVDALGYGRRRRVELPQRRHLLCHVPPAPAPARCCYPRRCRWRFRLPQKQAGRTKGKEACSKPARRFIIINDCWPTKWQRVAAKNEMEKALQYSAPGPAHSRTSGSSCFLLHVIT